MSCWCKIIDRNAGIFFRIVITVFYETWNVRMEYTASKTHEEGHLMPACESTHESFEIFREELRELFLGGYRQKPEGIGFNL